MQVENVKNSGGAQSQTLQKSLGPTTVDILYSSYNTVEGDQSWSKIRLLKLGTARIGISLLVLRSRLLPPPRPVFGGSGSPHCGGSGSGSGFDYCYKKKIWEKFFNN